MSRSFVLAWAVALAASLASAPVVSASAIAQPPKTGARVAAKPAAPAAAAPPKAALPAIPPGAGYRFGPQPAWVKPVPVSSTAPALTEARAAAGAGAGAGAGASGSRALRQLLVDVQIQQNAKPGPQSNAYFVRLQTMALDASTLREVSEPQISFNPAYQQLIIHSVAVVRDGQRSERLASSRVELMRREHNLERQMIDGVRTALIVINDVRVGDVVEASYTVEGDNPIFDGRLAAGAQLADDVPIDRLHWRLEAPLERKIAVKALASSVEPERFEEGGRQVLRVLRERVAPVQGESNTPPWFKVYPALAVTDYTGWDEVDAWAQRLFAPEKLHPSVAAQAAAIKAEVAAKGGTVEDQVAAALRFVQDEVRYFSVSLGESSHRPKPASQTLAERLGDCKDKTQLLNALLTALGVEAKPALVSVRRNRGVANYPPSHAEFDHVISRVRIGDAVYFLDSTMNGQGYSLARRGYVPYGLALVVGEGAAGLQSVTPPASALDAIRYRQDWDLSDLTRLPQLRVSFTAEGLAAERWRGHAAQAGVERVGEYFSGLYVKALPGLVGSAAPEWRDDREANRIELVLRFEHPQLGRYNRAALELDLPAPEMTDVLMLPSEGRRRMPYLLDTPRLFEQRTTVHGPRPLTSQAPPPQQVGDKHFSFLHRAEVVQGDAVFTSRFERRSDEVLPPDLDGYRERISRARAVSGHNVRLALVDRKGLEPEYDAIDKRLAKFRRGPKGDGLWDVLVANEVLRSYDSLLLERIGPSGPLRPRVLIERAKASNLLGDFAAGLADADAALPPTEPTATAATTTTTTTPSRGAALSAEDLAAAHEARGVALAGLGRMQDAQAAFQAQLAASGAGSPSSWLGVTHFMLGDFQASESALRETLNNASGEDRSFTLIWLYLASERQQPGRGKQALRDEAERADASQWSGALMRHLAGLIDREALLQMARAKPEMERLRLAEAYFYIGQQALVAGQRADAQPWFERSVATQAVPYRELSLARWELRRR